jgi:DNA polymerase-2
MPEITGWLLDLFAGPAEEVVLWLLGDDGARHRLHQPFPVTFYAAGPAPRLRLLWRFLEAQPVTVSLARAERQDLFHADPLPVLAIQVSQPAAQLRLFQQVCREFPTLSYYDADVALTLRYARQGFSAGVPLYPAARRPVQQIAALDPLGLDPPRRCAPSLDQTTTPLTPPNRLALRTPPIPPAVGAGPPPAGRAARHPGTP